MRLNELDRFASENVDLAGKRLLIFIVAYNAEATIERVLRRIPQSLRTNDTEVLIIDDSSRDETFARGIGYQQQNSEFKITVLRTP
jgi:glycosyltransferase involved in cell wall biosynthesis